MVSIHGEQGQGNGGLKFILAEGVSGNGIERLWQAVTGH